MIIWKNKIAVSYYWSHLPTKPLTWDIVLLICDYDKSVGVCFVVGFFVDGGVFCIVAWKIINYIPKYFRSNWKWDSNYFEVNVNWKKKKPKEWSETKWKCVLSNENF